jgi:hypothetical protein
MDRQTELTYSKYYKSGLDNPDILKDGVRDITPKEIITEIQKHIEDVMSYHGKAKISVTITEETWG